MNIKNLYIKIVSKYEEPNDQAVLEAAYQYLVKLSNYETEEIAKEYAKYTEEERLELLSAITAKNKLTLNYVIDNLERTTENSELARLLREIQKGQTYVAYQMRKLKKFIHVDNFIRQNIDSIDHAGQAIMLTEKEYSALLKSDNISPTNEALEIFYDSETIFCRILKLTRESVALALSKKSISVQKYDELMAYLDEKEKEDSQQDNKDS